MYWSRMFFESALAASSSRGVISFSRCSSVRILREQVVSLGPLRLALEVVLGPPQRLLALAGLEQGLRQKEGNLRVVLVVNQSAEEGLDGEVVPLGGEEDHAELEIGRRRGRLIAAQDALLVGGGEPVGRLLVKGLDHLGEGIGRPIDLPEFVPVELAELELGEQVALASSSPAVGSPERPSAASRPQPGSFLA